MLCSPEDAKTNPKRRVLAATTTGENKQFAIHTNLDLV
jgi:hypothetical protein